MNRMMELGLNGSASSKEKRIKLCEKLHIGYCNAKTLMKLLNMMDVSSKTVEELLNA